LFLLTHFWEKAKSDKYHITRWMKKSHLTLRLSLTYGWPWETPIKNGPAVSRQVDRNAVLNYKFDFTPVIDGLPALLLGCLGTLWLALSGMALAIVIGIGGVILRDSRVKLVRWLVIGFVELIRNTPFLVQIYFIFFALPLAGVRLDPTPTAIIALGVNGGAYAIEIIRGGVQSINKGQVEAGLALGLHKLSVFRFIVLKPALRAVFPSLASQFVLLTLTTSIASAVSAYELTSVAKRIESDSFRSFEVYGVVTLMYLVMSWIVMNILNFISSRYISSYPAK
jgi:polar amino acid transport system permease protein